MIHSAEWMSFFIGKRHSQSSRLGLLSLELFQIFAAWRHISSVQISSCPLSFRLSEQHCYGIRPKTYLFSHICAECLWLEILGRSCFRCCCGLSFQKCLGLGWRWPTSYHCLLRCFLDQLDFPYLQRFASFVADTFAFEVTVGSSTADQQLGCIG